ncbi:hypothetical protein ASF28_10540 [Methylobacterium sp. Leaf99]|uniref:hypothetical protein n=1 Tax=unclassified Methylobacterium TaxID=2615210 RepID=UPI0006FBC3EA|nr:MULTISPECIES: hypothetical protein [unclassified Methylobacterium]KQP07572.1 hypothetical protein ASF28_10540 [Methylobacterium sp. Leaf99]TXM75280.1 hypothetical protein FV218_08885 [Methylobacterium sp. WL69]
MSEFADLIARAVNPSMTREARESVYGVVKEAVQRLQTRDGMEPDDPRIALQQHLVEETIRDVEADIARFTSLEKLERAHAAQVADEAAAARRR